MMNVNDSYNRSLCLHILASKGMCNILHPRNFYILHPKNISFLKFSKKNVQATIKFISKRAECYYLKITDHLGTHL